MNKKGQMGSLNFLQDFVIIFAIAGLTLVIVSKVISQSGSSLTDGSSEKLAQTNVSAGLNEVSTNMSLLGTVGILIVIIGLIIGLRGRGTA